MTISRFDAVVWAVMLVLAGLTTAVIVAGSHVGLAITQVTPGVNMNGASTLSQVRVTFEAAIVSAPDTAVVLSPTVDGDTTVAGSTLIFQPAAPFQPDTTYQVTLAAGVVGENGRALQEPFSWTFYTGQPRILYIGWEDDRANQIYMAGLTGAPPIPLTDVATDVLDFAVAPDGSQITYAVLEQTAASSLWLMNADGSEPREILACPDASCSRPVWLPDGRRLIYERRNIPFPGAPPGNPRLWWLDLFTGETVPVFQDNQLLGLFVTVSPDGAWLSFVSPLEQGIELYNLQDGSGKLIPNRMGTAVSWSPDSRRIALADIVTDGQDWSILAYAIEVATDETVTLSQPLAEGVGMDDSNPVWSPDGRHIAFSRKEPRTPMGRQIWLMQPDGRNSRPLTGEPDLHHSQHSWSPDGQTLLYQRYNLKELYAQPGVWILDVSTGQATEIAFPATQPAWLP